MFLDVTEARRLLMGMATPEDDYAVEHDLLPMAQSAVEDFLGYELEQASHTEYYPRDLAAPQLGRNEGIPYLTSSDRLQFFSGVSGEAKVLTLDNLPLRSVTSIYEDPSGYFGTVAGSFGSGTLLTEGTDFAPMYEQAGLCRSGSILRISGTWATEPGSIKVTYSSGWSATEIDARERAKIKRAIWLTLHHYWNAYHQAKLGMAGQELASESLGGGVSVSYVQSMLMGLGIPDEAASLLEKSMSFDDVDV